MANEIELQRLADDGCPHHDDGPNIGIDRRGLLLVTRRWGERIVLFDARTGDLIGTVHMQPLNRNKARLCIDLPGIQVVREETLPV